MKAERKISGGIYVIIDPSLGAEYIVSALQKVIKGGADVLQIWNYWHRNQKKTELIDAVCSLAHAKDIPVLINEEWQLLRVTALDGVHFDQIPPDIDTIRKQTGRPFICGITCGNDLERIQWANDHQFDYISFCSMFPSPSAGICEIVKKETVQKARQLTSLPLFVAGGITLDNVDELTNTGMNGMALISAIMKSEDPQSATRIFKDKLNQFKTYQHANITHQ